MFSRKNKILLFSLGLALSGILYSATQYVITNGSLQMIDEFDICRDVQNSSGQSILVPTNSANEWCGNTAGCTGGSGSQSFLNNPPSNVIVCNTCGAKSCGTDSTPESFTLADTGLMYTATSSDTVSTIDQTITLYFNKISGSASPTVKKNGTSQGTLSTNLTVSVVEGDTIALELSSCGEYINAKVEVRYDNSSGAIVNGNSDVDLECSSYICGGVAYYPSNDEACCDDNQIYDDTTHKCCICIVKPIGMSCGSPNCSMPTKTDVYAQLFQAKGARCN